MVRWQPVYWYPFSLLVLGLLIFHSVLFKSFVLDDISSIVTNTAVHSLESIPSFFFNTLHFNTGLTGFIYRPVTFTVHTTLYWLDHGRPFVFHLFLLLLYITNSILVYCFLTRFTKPLLAFLLSFLFLIHPANIEIASYIADIQDALYFFFGISALLVVTSTLTQKKQLFFSSILLLLACLSKEAGVLFILGTGLYIFIARRQSFRLYALTYGLLFLGYFLLRAYAGQTAFATITVPPQSTIQDLNLYTHMLLVPKMLAYYLTAIVMPLPALPTKYLATNTLPVSGMSFIFVLLVYLGLWIMGKRIQSKKASRWYLSFFCFFLVSSIFHSQLIPLDVLVAKRWLYIQIFTFIAMVAVLLNLYARLVKKHVLIFLMFYLLFAGILLAETIILMQFY